MKILFALFTFALLLSACNSEEKKGKENQKTKEADTTQVDTTNQLKDTTQLSEEELKEQGYSIESEEEDKIMKELNKQAVQWDFCDCVVKNDSVQKAIETADDNQIDAIFARMEEIDKHCKHLLTAPNTTPKERNAYQARVKKCLRNARKK